MKLPVHASRLLLLAIRLLRLDQLPFVFLDIREQLTEFLFISLCQQVDHIDQIK